MYDIYRSRAALKISHMHMATQVEDEYALKNKIDLSACETDVINSLPEGMRIHGCMVIRGRKDLEQLPEDLRVKGYFDVSDCSKLSTIPERLKCGWLYVQNCFALKQLPKDIAIDVFIFTGGSSLTLEGVPEHLRRSVRD